jgi:hypothetical protein
MPRRIANDGWICIIQRQIFDDFVKPETPSPTGGLPLHVRTFVNRSIGVVCCLDLGFESLETALLFSDVLMISVFNSFCCHQSLARTSETLRRNA